MRKVISLTLLIIIVVACNQNMLGMGQAISNFFSAPFGAVKSLFTNSSYEDEMKKTEKANSQKENINEEVACEESSEVLDKENKENLRKISSILKQLKCQCRAWGTCQKDVCSCEKLCPDNFNIFKRPEFSNIEDLTSEENGLAFRSGKPSQTYKSTQGYCWGHARINAQFNRLAFFDEKAKAPFNLLSPDPEEQNRSIQYYKGLIDKIASNEATTIPGFKNLGELSLHPALQSYLGDKVAKVWAKQAMSFQGVKVAIGDEKSPLDEYKKTFSDIKERLSLGVQPTIIFTKRGNSFDTHAVLVSHVTKKPDIGEVLCIRNNNDSEKVNSKCQHYLKLSKDGDLVYDHPAWGLLGKMEIAHNENADMLAQKKSLLDRCRGEKGCPAKAP